MIWVPPHARWSYLKSTAALPIGSFLWYEHKGKVISEEEALQLRQEHKELIKENDDEEKKKDPVKDIKLRSISWLIDNALDEIEKANPKLKGILNSISQYQLENEKLTGLINTFSDTSFSKAEYNGKRLDLHSKDILGHVYEYFLGQFALAEGKQGGQYYTPKSIVTLFVEMLEPYEEAI